MLGPTLTGRLVTLAPIQPQHLPNYCRWFADPEITAYIEDDTPRSLKQQEERFERVAHSETDVVWAILAEDRHVGGTGLFQIHWQSRHAKSGILIGEKDCWGRGYATEAMRLRTAFAFEQLGLEKVWTTAFLENVASRRALERVGYREVGVHRRHCFRHGHWHDLWVSELLREDWERARPST
jgi:[ribosomal protein S5]-alanine N-acetyltransferase